MPIGRISDSSPNQAYPSASTILSKLTNIDLRFDECKEFFFGKQIVTISVVLFELWGNSVNVSESLLGGS